MHSDLLNLINSTGSLPVVRSAEFVTRSFIERHPYRIDFPDGTHQRFATLIVAARSGLEVGREVWDEHGGKAWTVGECRKVVNASEKDRRRY